MIVVIIVLVMEMKVYGLVDRLLSKYCGTLGIHYNSYLGERRLRLESFFWLEAMFSIDLRNNTRYFYYEQYIEVCFESRKLKKN